MDFKKLPKVSPRECIGLVIFLECISNKLLLISVGIGTLFFAFGVGPAVALGLYLVAKTSLKK